MFVNKQDMSLQVLEVRNVALVLQRKVEALPIKQILLSTQRFLCLPESEISAVFRVLPSFYSMPTSKTKENYTKAVAQDALVPLFDLLRLLELVS